MIFDDAPWADRHVIAKHCKNADQTERAALEFGSAPVTAGIEDDKIAGVLEEEDDVDPADWNGAEAAAENAGGDTLSELERREKVLGVYYPFSLQGGCLVYRGSWTGVYEFCLAVSLSPNLKGKPYKDLATMFELLACETAKRYLGTRARAVRTGWPSHSLVERPVKFKALSKIVEEKSGEWRWKANAHPSDPSHKQVKDEGVDYVVWLPMPDERNGKMFMLGQCACGNDWDTKLEEITAVRLGQYLEPVSEAPFARAFSVPRHIPGQKIFTQCNMRAGVTFDRARITILSEEVESRTEMLALATTWKLEKLAQHAIPQYQRKARP